MISHKPKVFNAKTWEKKRKQDFRDEMEKFERRLNKKTLKDFENRLNEDRSCMPEKKRPKEIRLEKTAGAESPVHSKLKKELRTPMRIEIDGRAYTRSCTQGSMGAETLVRLNVEALVSQAKEIGKKAIAEKDGRMLLDLCLDPIYGMDRTGFTDTKGNQMSGDGRAVQEMIKQFFKDESMMHRLKNDIICEFYSKK